MSRVGAGRKTGKGTKRRKTKASAKGAMWPWYMAGVLIVGGIAAYDNLSTVRRWFHSPEHLVAASVPLAKIVKKKDESSHTAGIPAPGYRPVEKGTLRQNGQVLPKLTPPENIPAVQTVGLRPTSSGPFYFCTDQKTNCVIDGANFWFQGQTIALADVSMPRMRKAKCDAERELGSQAKRRLREILNTGEFKLLAANGKPAGDAGGQMHVVLSDGTLISDRLIAEGLAHSPKDAGKPWC